MLTKKYNQAIQTPELDDRDTLLELLKESATLAKQDRWNPRAMKTGLAKYQDALMAQQVCLKQIDYSIHPSF